MNEPERLLRRARELAGVAPEWRLGLSVDGWLVMHDGIPVLFDTSLRRAVELMDRLATGDGSLDPERPRGQWCRYDPAPTWLN